MEANSDDHAAPRPDKASSKQQSPPQHSSFTFATPPNPRNMPGRKRARTLEYPQTAPASHSPGDDAKVKGGHSLRKRARIDYAQMNEHEDDQHAHAPPTHATEGIMEITVSGARSARKRRATADPNYDQEDAQPTALPPQKKKPRTVEKQRTVSPVPQRRPYQKRKSTVAATISLDSPERQPSDTELKDTIEVGAPLNDQSNSSSQTRSSETASNVSGQSPLKNVSHSLAIASSEATQQTKFVPIANGSKVDSDLQEATDTSTQQSFRAGDASVLSSTRCTQTPPLDLNQNKENGAALPTQANAPNQNGIIQHSPEPNVAPASTDGNPPVGHEEKQDSIDHLATPANLQNNNPPRAPSETAQSTHQTSSQESVDSDTTEIVPPSLIPTAATSVAEPPVGERSKMANKGKGRQAAVEAQAPLGEPEEVKQDAPKLGLRPRVSHCNQNFHLFDDHQMQANLATPTETARKPAGREHGCCSRR